MKKVTAGKGTIRITGFESPGEIDSAVSTFKSGLPVGAKNARKTNGKGGSSMVSIKPPRSLFKETYRDVCEIFSKSLAGG